jgi:crotonobetainyl-CoA:carnitine CoA-transferase CaiB-like acyl-CoA transferase
MPGPLDGIRIVDLTMIYSGPICTSILGDQGADIIKVESQDGDWMRTPALVQRNGVNGPFAMMNRNKRSVVIDLATEEGRGVFRVLVGDADVVVENYRPGVMERLGLDYESLKGINEGLIFASINGVGHSGPYSHRRVYDAIIQSISGIGSLQANPKTERPILVNSLICDKLTAMTAAQAITAAIVARERSGVGQRVDVSMLDSALFFLWPDNMQFHTFIGEDFPYPAQGSHVNMIRETRDGYICTMPVQAEEWQAVLRALNLSNLLEDERYQTEDGINMVAFNAALNEAFKLFSTEDLVRRFDEQQVPFATVMSREEVVDDPQVKAVESLWEFEHPFAGPMRQARPPGRFSETPAAIFRSSPELGEHTREVLADAGFTQEQIKDLRQRKIVR